LVRAEKNVENYKKIRYILIVLGFYPEPADDSGGGAIPH
jgi:hypothetical protein